MSACNAMEDALDVVVDERIRALRRLLYCGEWIQSHALHVYLLHAPDFLGCEDAVELAERDRGAVERGLDLKRTGNLVMETVGGRAVHPVNVRSEGSTAPRPRCDRGIGRPVVQSPRPGAGNRRLGVRVDFPDVEAEYRFVALREPDRYAIESGRAVTSDGST